MSSYSDRCQRLHTDITLSSKPSAPKALQSTQGTTVTVMRCEPGVYICVARSHPEVREFRFPSGPTMSYILTWKDWAVTLVTLLVTTFLKLDKSRKVVSSGSRCLTCVIYSACQYASIPTVGGSDLPLLSWLTSINFFMNGKALLSEGYRQVGVATTRC